MVHTTSRARERPAIVEVHSVAQMKDERPGIGLIPALRQRGREVEARIARHQAVEEQLVNVFRLRIRSDARIEIGGAALDQKDDRVRIALRGAARGQRKQNAGIEREVTRRPWAADLAQMQCRLQPCSHISHLAEDRWAASRL